MGGHRPWEAVPPDGLDVQMNMYRVAPPAQQTACQVHTRALHIPSKSPSRVLAASSEDDTVSWHNAQSSKAALRRV